MKSKLYLLVGWTLILIAGLSGLAMLNNLIGGNGLINICNLFLIQESCIAGSSYLPFILVINNFLAPLFFIGIFLIPGIYYIKIKEKNRLTNWAVGLNLAGLILVILTFLIFFILALLAGDFEGFFWAIAILGVPFGLVPAGILYVIAIILLVINWFKKKLGKIKSKK